MKTTTLILLFSALMDEAVWYEVLDWSMIWVCIIGVAVHILFLEISHTKIKNRLVTYLFYLLSSILVLAFISEVAGYVISSYTSLEVQVQSGVKHFLAAISGLGGSYITRSLIKKISSNV